MEGQAAAVIRDLMKENEGLREELKVSRWNENGYKQTYSQQRRQAFEDAAKIAEKIHIECAGKLNQMAPSQQIIAALRQGGRDEK